MGTEDEQDAVVPRHGAQKSVRLSRNWDDWLEYEKRSLL